MAAFHNIGRNALAWVTWFMILMKKERKLKYKKAFFHWVSLGFKPMTSVSSCSCSTAVLQLLPTLNVIFSSLAHPGLFLVFIFRLNIMQELSLMSETPFFKDFTTFLYCSHQHSYTNLSPVILSTNTVINILYFLATVHWARNEFAAEKKFGLDSILQPSDYFDCFCCL